MEKERTVILSELEGYRNHPGVRLRDLVNASAWLCHPYRRPVIGWREDVTRLTPEQLRAFYRAYYQPNNATLVVVGDFDPAQLRPAVARWFDGIPAGPLPAERVSPPEKQEGERRVLLRDHGQAGLVQLQVHIPPATDADHFALTLANDALTNGKSSRLYRALVDTGLAAEISGSSQEMIEHGAWYFSAVCQQGVAPEKVEAVLRRELERAGQKALRIKP
jgi:zinc protease